MTQPGYETIDVRPLSPAVGAEIRGVDLAGDLGNAQFAEIRRAFHEHGAVFFREQRLTPEQHVAFARRFGPINVNRFFQPVDGHPEIAEVRKEPHHKRNIGAGWHTDHSYDAAPALGSMLYAHEVPDCGGDTLFASMEAAFAALSPRMQDMLRGMRALHSSRHVFGARRYQDEPQEYAGRLGNPELATQDAVHPVVIHHPQTGREVLYVNPGFTVRFDGWTEAESRPLLGFLYRHAAHPSFTCRFRWEVGSIALWDNRSTWHMALNDYPGKRRYMHRVTIDGSPLA
ncbi:MAG: TauD/TfdA family dioxygenase [Ectothiorhodospiraceae bacterium]|nr:TauD/TfdA family dioxygenase [Ectothiorhodospiraceae bacterium]